MAFRIALWSHDSVGLGHVRRNLAIAHALARELPPLVGEPVTGILLTGQSSATSFATPPGWDWVVLPSITIGADGYRSRHLEAGIERVTAMRSGAAAGVLSAFGPDLLVVDRHPFGVRGELRPTLDHLRSERPSCAVVLGLRDVLDRAPVARSEWRDLGGSAAVRAFFDAIWIYGDPAVHDMRRSGELPPGLHDLVAHTGYLAHGRPRRSPEDRATTTAPPYVLTTVGGGSDGLDIALAAARAEVPSGHRHLIVTGPQMPDGHRAEVRAAASPGTRVEESVPDLPELAAGAAAVVSMGGYNTVCEVMSTTTPLLIVPRRGRRDEQLIRAGALAARGAAETVDGPLTPDRVARFFAAQVGDRRPRSGIDLDGLRAVPALAVDAVAAARSREVIADAV